MPTPRKQQRYSCMTDPKQEAELREQILGEFRQVLKLAPADYAENCTNVVMNTVNAHTTKLLNEQLERLSEAERYAIYPLRMSKAGVLEPTHETAVPLSAIEKERENLKGDHQADPAHE